MPAAANEKQPANNATTTQRGLHYFNSKHQTTPTKVGFGALPPDFVPSLLMPPASGSSPPPRPETDLEDLGSLARPLLPVDLSSTSALDKELDIVSLGAQLEQATEQVEMDEDEGEIMEVRRATRPL